MQKGIEESPPQPNEEGARAKFYSVKLEPGISKKLEELKITYRSPSISHTLRILIEDAWNRDFTEKYLEYPQTERKVDLDKTDRIILEDLS